MDQKNLLIAIVLSVAILFGFQYLAERFLPHAPPPPPKTATQTPPASPLNKEPGGTAPEVATRVTSATPETCADRSRDRARFISWSANPQR